MSVNDIKLYFEWKAEDIFELQMHVWKLIFIGKFYNFTLYSLLYPCSSYEDVELAQRKRCQIYFSDKLLIKT